MIESTGRGSGRTTRALMKLVEQVLGGPPPNLGVYVITNSKEIDYCMQLIKDVLPESVKEFSRSSHTAVFRNGGRIRFMLWDDENLVPFSLPRWVWLVRGCRQDTPIIWDHRARDTWSFEQTKKEIGRGKGP